MLLLSYRTLGTVKASFHFCFFFHWLNDKVLVIVLGLRLIFLRYAVYFAFDIALSFFGFPIFLKSNPIVFPPYGFFLFKPVPLGGSLAVLPYNRLCLARLSASVLGLPLRLGFAIVSPFNLNSPQI